MAVSTEEPLPQRERESRLRRGARWLTPVALAAACAGLFWCYARLAATFPGGSDAASNALEAWDLLHGNWLFFFFYMSYF